MDVIIIFNGLGNQMSQYALYLQKKTINKSTHIILFGNAHNGFELNKVFNAPYNKNGFSKLLYILFRILLTDKLRIISMPLQRLLNLLNCKIVKENFDYRFNKNYLIPSKGITFYYGGWHSPNYFSTEEDVVREAFTFKEPADEQNIAIIDLIKNTNSVGIHVRRGDYLDADNLSLFGGVCTQTYFQKAIDFVESKITNPHFFVFSNDIPWVKENLNIQNVTYVICNTGKNSWKDMYLMSICKNNIISNSTFSWWSAWLNKNPDKVIISPSRFLNTDKFTDIYPQSWIRLSDY